MGSALASRLRDGGFAVRGFDTDAQGVAAFAALGGEVAGDANAVLGTCDVVLLSLPSHREVRAVLAEGAAHLRAGQIILDTTTGEPDAAIESAHELAMRGVFYLDSTISGDFTPVREILAPAADYEATERETRVFFQTIQNKLHFAATGRTAAELIAERADSAQPNMGLMAWRSGVVRKGAVTVAKNYLREDKIEELNRLVVMFLDFAEDHARRKKQIFLQN